MSVIRHHPDLPIAPAQQSVVPGWHGLLAMTPPQTTVEQIIKLLRDIVRPVARPLKRAARSVLANQTSRQIAALRAQQEDLTSALRELMAQRQITVAGTSQRKLVWISSWQTRCGIAEYSRQMLEALQAQNAGWRVTVLHDERPIMPQINDVAGVSARPGFALDGANIVSRLALGIAAEQADCVVIQHHAALIPWPVLADLLLHPAIAARRVVVQLHNTQDILGLPSWLRQRLHVALQGADRVLAHTTRDMRLLRAFGLNNAQRITHGCAQAAAVMPARELPPDSAPLIGTAGFLLPHKGALALIRATAALRDVWPDIRLRLVTARYGSRQSQAEWRACTTLARKLGFEAHLEWHTEFAPARRVLQLLAPCDLLVLPYGKTAESSSGAARLAVASGVATLVSDQPIFNDLGDAVARLNEVVAGGLAGQMEEWLHATRRRGRLQQQAATWRAAHDWQLVGQEMDAVLDSLVPAHCTA